MLKLIVTNARSIHRTILPQKIDTKPLCHNDSFVFHFQELSPNLYVFRAKDYAHDLSCEMPVEVTETFVSMENDDEEGGYFAPAVSCNFPTISLEKLNKKIDFNNYIRGILVRQFQLNILEQLLLFCDEKRAAKLILTMTNIELDYLEIYSRFFISEERVLTSKGEQIQVVIPTDVHTYDEIVDFVDELEQDFRKILWREQRTNPAFREYLMSHSCL